ncbi:PEP/pyruvate-binding domain-containing protein [Desulfomarina sp.]
MFNSTLFQRWIYRFFAPHLLQRNTYEAFKRLLEEDRKCHELIADFQDLFFRKDPAEWTRIAHLYAELSLAVGAMVKEVTAIAGRDTADLAVYYKKFDSYIRYLLQPPPQPTEPPFILRLEDSRIHPSKTGNKAANLGRIVQELGHPVPPGFVITTNAWNRILEHNDLRPEINNLLLNFDPANSSSLQTISKSLTGLIESIKLPPDLEQPFNIASQQLIKTTENMRDPVFAVRSSAVNEDGMNSFAGQYLSLLNVPPDRLLDGYRKVLASKYSPKALLYRISAGISDTEAPMAVVIMKMVQAEQAGVIYTTDPTGREKETVFIHGVRGSGEKLVSGKTKSELIRFHKTGGNYLDNFSDLALISRNQADDLVRIALDLELFFGAAQDVEWASDQRGVVILQSRPLKTADEIPEENSRENLSMDNLPLLYHGGITASAGIASGPSFFPGPQQDPDSIPFNAILIVEHIPASLILLLPRCSGVIAAHGSVASHFSTICRELGIPLVVNAEGINSKVRPKEQITVDAVHRKVYRGADKTQPLFPRDTSTKKNHPYFRRLQAILDFITPLSVLDPDGDDFIPGACRSFHDIVRYAHEKGVQSMFAIGSSGSRRGRRKLLKTDLPFELYLMNVDETAPHHGDIITIDQVHSTPFQALWHGLTHPSITWGDHQYYNWKQYDRGAMTDGFVFADKSESASYGVYAADYLNLNIRFGYHFTVVDTLCGKNSEQNYCTIRFAGGGGTVEGRYFRLKYLETILRRLGFSVNAKTDLLDARIETLPTDRMNQCLVTLGRMLGTSKLMDMVLKDRKSVASHLDHFFQIDDRFGVP